MSHSCILLVVFRVVYTIRFVFECNMIMIDIFDIGCNTEFCCVSISIDRQSRECELSELCEQSQISWLSTIKHDPEGEA